MSFANIAHLFRPTSDPYHDRDLLAAFGAQPDDKPTLLVPETDDRRFVAGHNAAGEYGVWDRDRNAWAVFPQEEWVGSVGRAEAISEAEQEEESAG